MTDTLKLLTTPTKDFELYLFDGDKERLEEAVFEWSKSCNMLKRKVRGNKMLDCSSTHNEFASAFQFPNYYGENWNALIDCLDEVYEESLAAAGLLTIITEPQLVLIRDPEQLPSLQAAMTSVASRWSEPDFAGNWWDRPALSFKVLVPVPLGQEHLVERWNEVPKRRI